MKKQIKAYFDEEFKQSMKKQIENDIIKDPYNFKTQHKKIFDQCEEKLLKYLENDSKNLTLFNTYRNALIEHFLEVRDIDCINVYISALGKKLADKLFEEKFKQ